MDGEELKYQGISWLREGGDIEAAAVLERCDLVERYVDEGFPLGSDEVITIIDVDVYASRLDTNLATRDNGKIAGQIEKTLHELVEHGTAIRNIIWRGKVGGNPIPSDSTASALLTVVDASTVREAWQKALDRRTSDPTGAITAARTLLETVCKHILDEGGVGYDESADLPKLYGLVAQQLNLAPTQYTEQALKQILGGCVSVVQGLATLRNRLSDAHGVGRTASRPAPRHAELAVNLAGSMAAFLLATWEASQKRSTEGVSPDVAD